MSDVNPSSAITFNSLNIPIGQLELLAKPLTLEGLQTEAAA